MARLRKGEVPHFNYSARVRQTNTEYVKFLLANPDAIRPEDEKMLARRASWAEWQEKKPGSHPNADPRHKQWSQYYYHRSDQ